MKKRHAFTLIELLVVIAVIAILLAVLIPALRAAKNQAKKTVCSGHVAGLVLATRMYTDDWDGDFVQIYWGDKPSSLIGQESNANALIDQAVYEAIFTPDDTGSMFVAGQLAGYAEAYDSFYEVWETDIVFVYGDTYVDIYAMYNASYWDIEDAIDFIEGIYF